MCVRFITVTISLSALNAEPAAPYVPAVHFAIGFCRESGLTISLCVYIYKNGPAPFGRIRFLYRLSDPFNS